MRGNLRGTLMRYFLFLSLSITFLPAGIIEASFPCWLIFFTGAFQGGWSGNRSTSFCAIPVTTVTGRTNKDLCLATATMVKASRAEHRQKGRWGLNLFPRCVTLTEGRAFARFWGMASSMTVKSLWRHTFLIDTHVITILAELCLLYWSIRHKKTSPQHFEMMRLSNEGNSGYSRYSANSCGFGVVFTPSGPEALNPHPKAGYMEAIFIFVTNEFFLAIRCGPYMTPPWPCDPTVWLDPPPFKRPQNHPGIRPRCSQREIIYFSLISALSILQRDVRHCNTWKPVQLPPS